MVELQWPLLALSEQLVTHMHLFASLCAPLRGTQYGFK
jgi:hypothetical protein